MNIILGLCLLVFSVKQVTSLKCYECVGAKCNDPFNEKNAKQIDCSGSCLKGEAAGDVVRGCIPGVKKNYCKEVDGVKVCYCTEDLCNVPLKCYECLTGCDDPFNENDAKKTDCYGSCLKREANGHVMRGCDLGVKKNDCEEVKGGKLCYCTEDLCNGAPKKSVGSGESVKQVTSLKCYVCAGAKCNDPFNEKDATQIDCSGSCTKGEAAGRVVRSCNPGVEKNDCKKVAGVKVCYCNEDLCNGAPKKSIGSGESGGYMSRSSFLVTIACICLSVLKFNF